MNELSKQLLASAEVLVEQLIEKNCEKLVSQALDAIAKGIPGQIDDVLIASVKVQVIAAVKAEAMKLAEQISKD
jgi:hypothetical protein